MRPWFGLAASWAPPQDAGAPLPGDGRAGAAHAPARPLTENMVKVLEALVALDDAAQDLDRERGVRTSPGRATFPASRIAYAAGFRTGRDVNPYGKDGRRMSPAQRVVTPIRHLTERGLVRSGRRSDGMTGSAHAITDEGRRVLADLERGGTS